MSAIQEHQGDILTITHGILVHGCDPQSDDNSPLLGALRTRYPGAVRVYREAKEAGRAAPGQVVFYQVPSPGDDRLIIASAVMLSGPMPDIGAAGACLKAIAAAAREANLPVHFPALPGVPSVMFKAFIDTALGTDIERHLWLPA